MNDYQIFIKDIFDSYKCKKKYDILHMLPVYDTGGDLIAYLRPITADYRKTIKNCALLMGKWRAENPSISASSFEITTERTERWLDNLIIGRDDRLLFMIETLGHDYIGHVGYSNFCYETQTAEIDSILRGVKNDYPGIMTFSIISLLKWGKETLKLKNIELSTDTDNLKSQALYQRCGFVFKSKKAMIKRILPDEVRWDMAEDPDMPNAERYALIMEFKGEL